MKKYISPMSEVMVLQMESVIASSLQINNEGTANGPLCNDREGWSMDDWCGEEE